MIKYKFTTLDNKSYIDTIWKVGISKETDGKIKKLCTDSWLHFYHTPEIAIVMQSYHISYMLDELKLWECEVEGEILDNDYGLKAGCTKMTLLREINKPQFVSQDLIRLSYLCLNKIFKSEKENLSTEELFLFTKILLLVEKLLENQEDNPKENINSFCLEYNQKENISKKYQSFFSSVLSLIYFHSILNLDIYNRIMFYMACILVQFAKFLNIKDFSDLQSLILEAKSFSNLQNLLYK